MKPLISHPRWLVATISGLAFAAPVAAQSVPDTNTASSGVHAAAPPSTVARAARRPPTVLPGALLPASRIVAFYGNPLSQKMGILGALPPQQMMDKLAATAARWARADSTHSVRPALQLIATVAQARPGADGKYRLRQSDSLIAKVAGWAESRGWLLFLDIQVGQSTVAEELPRLVPWLRKPWVHLALDPEFAMQSGRVPGRKFGTLDAREVNQAVDLLARLVDEEHLPPKVLVVHRFTHDMLTHASRIKQDPRVQVVIDMDGFGQPAFKKHIYNLIITRNRPDYSGFKLFYKNDRPMMTLQEVLALRPVPLYIQYQ